MSFFRHEEIYRSDGGPGRGSRTAAPAHRGDEFPTGYSLAGCAPAEPASALPVVDRISGPRQRDNQFSANGEPSLFILSQCRGPLQYTHSLNLIQVAEPAGWCSISNPLLRGRYLLENIQSVRCVTTFTPDASLCPEALKFAIKCLSVNLSE